jgi:hypothetical protein
MRPLYEDFEDFDELDFPENMAIDKVMRSPRRSERRAFNKKRLARYAADPSDGMDDFDIDDDINDYDDDEFDTYAGLDLGH